MIERPIERQISAVDFHPFPQPQIGVERMKFEYLSRHLKSVRPVKYLAGSSERTDRRRLPD
jgi:hypothetical protein